MNDIPTHIGIIMDGNGRYAKRNNQIRSFGHIQGAKRVEPICRYCDKIGVKYLTLYAFSTENYKRPKDEVDKIMELLYTYLGKFIKPMLNNNMHFMMIGDKSLLDKKLLKRIEDMEEKSKKNKGLHLILAINYGARDEILRAFTKLLNSKDSLDNFENYLDTNGLPDPDLIIRTGGEMRLSNFLLWQVAYSELYFTNKYWPEFTEDDLKTALEDYAKRKRRFGGL